MRTNLKARVSVVIPTLNEATLLPGLLEALATQTSPPDEVIVADAGSTDGTPDIVRETGAIVVAGGPPAVGRNAGARVATGDVLVFLDADVMPSPEFLERAMDAFADAGYAVATCLVAPLTDRPIHRLSVDVTNLYLLVIKPFSPHAPGSCILVRHDVHDAIGGFDETLKLAEDHDYAQRAAKIGRFGVIAEVRIATSARRLEEEGLVGLAYKYLWCEIQALAGRPIHSLPFSYDFGMHMTTTNEHERPIVDIGRLRQQLGRFDNPLTRLSATGLAELERLASLDPPATRRAALDSRDLDTLQRYLRRRRALLRLTGRWARLRLREREPFPTREVLKMLDPRGHRRPPSV